MMNYQRFVYFVLAMRESWDVVKLNVRTNITETFYLDPIKPITNKKSQSHEISVEKVKDSHF